MANVFISYRRQDDPYAARTIANALSEHFGKDNVCFDVDAMRAGFDFRPQITSMVAKCDVMLVVIGDEWLEALEGGRPRLEDPDDSVAFEVSSALERGIAVIPVLVGNAAIPEKSALPERLRALVYRQAVEIRASASFGAQIQKLIREIEMAAPTRRPMTLFRISVAMVAVVALAVIAWVTWTAVTAQPEQKIDPGKQTREQATTVSNLADMPTIEVIDPVITAALEVQLAAGVSERLIIGRAQTTGTLREVTVNGKRLSTNENGYFTETIQVPAGGTEVRITAVNSAGRGSIRSFTLKPFGSPASTSRPRSVVGLIVDQRGGCADRTGKCDNVWDASRKHSLTYCVSLAFGNQHNRVVKEMEAATGAWESAADVDFVHDATYDQDCGPRTDAVVFDVSPSKAGDSLAKSFFPDDPRIRRSVVIDTSALELPSGPLQLVGVLRETMGHTLGFRHEHTRPEARACFEDSNWRALSANSYNPYSVMHYKHCNGLGDGSMVLTESDKNGAACLYGPAKGFAFDTTVCRP